MLAETYGADIDDLDDEILQEFLPNLFQNNNLSDEETALRDTLQSDTVLRDSFGYASRDSERIKTQSFTGDGSSSEPVNKSDEQLRKDFMRSLRDARDTSSEEGTPEGSQELI